MADLEVTTSLGTYAVPDEVFAEHMRRGDGHQRADVDIMCGLIRPGDLVLDVGAFVGTVSTPLARAVGPQGRVVAFEGWPEHVRMLRDNIARNGVANTVVVVATLISSRKGAVTAHTYDHHSTATTWYEPAEADADSALNLASTTLDAWYAEHGRGRSISLIKIDVEGMEYDVLRGAERILAEHHPALHVEVASYQLARYGATLADLDTFLRRHGYRQYLSLPVGAKGSARLGRLASTKLFGPMLGDVVAVHSASNRAAGLIARFGWIRANLVGARPYWQRVRRLVRA